VRKRGVGLIRQEEPQRGMRKDSGRSYRNNRTRISHNILKHANGQLNVIATCCLDFDNPIPYFEISEKYTNGSIFAKYVQNRNVPNHIRYDIQDRHSSHFATKANYSRGDPSVSEIYQEVGLVQDFVPAGMPILDPIELLFSRIDKDLRDSSSKYNQNGAGWKLEDMATVMRETMEKITFKDVQGWYRRSYVHLYGGMTIPLYLREDISRSKFEREIARVLELIRSREDVGTYTRSGRLSVQTNK
jgi:hypothetical protein